MKNKSKLNKIKAKKNSQPTVPAEWLYLTEQEITTADIAAAFEDQEKVEIWEAAGVAEVILGEKASMDMEWTENDLGDEVSNQFLEQHQIKNVFLVTIPPQEYEAAQSAMRKIMEKNGGFFCGDTEDFTPVVQ